MIEVAGAFVFIVGTFVISLLLRDGARTSKALWIPIIWMFLACSRPVSLWLHVQQIGTEADAQLEGSPLDRNVFTVLIVSGLCVLVRRGRKVAAVLQKNATVVLFLLYCGLSIVWSDFPDVAFKRWVRAVGDVIMVLIVLTDGSPFTAAKAFLARLGFIIAPLSILSDLSRGFSLPYHVGLTVANKNLYGAVSMILGLAALWHLLEIRRGKERKRRRKLLIVYGCVLALTTWSTWWANSGTAKGCLLLGIFPIAILSRWSLAKRPLVVHAIVASIVFLACYASIINPDAGVVSAMGKDPTLTGRTEVWSAVIALNPSPWIGAGFESFWLGPRLKAIWNVFVWHPNEAHNGYLETYLNLGWIGVFLLGVVILNGYGKVLRAFRSDRQAGSLWLSYVVLIVVYNLTEAGFRIFSPTWIVFLLSMNAGYALNQDRMHTKIAFNRLRLNYSEACA